jgi:hypothetical protein
MAKIEIVQPAPADPDYVLTLTKSEAVALRSLFGSMWPSEFDAAARKAGVEGTPLDDIYDALYKLVPVSWDLHDAYKSARKAMV